MPNHDYTPNCMQLGDLLSNELLQYETANINL